MGKVNKSIRNVLVFPGGTEVGLEIWRALRNCKEVNLFSASSADCNHAPYVFSNHFTIPPVKNKNWIRALNRLIKKHNIDYIFPAYDDILVELSENQEKINAKVIASPKETCLITRSKSRTYDFFNDILPTPKVYKSISKKVKFPVFVKPDKGQGSQDAERTEDLLTLKSLIRNNPELIMMEFLPGKEYTVDCFSDRDKGLLFCGGRERIRIRSGISVGSKPVRKKAFREYAEIISSKLELHGAWFFQLKEDEKGFLRLLEIASRVSGTMATYRVLGLNFPLLSLYEVERKDIEIMLNRHDLNIDRALTNRYSHNIKYDRVYIDFDDTVVLKGKINTQVIKFLYQCINENKKVILISKHKNQIKKTLERFRLKGLFEKVIHIKKEDSKYNFINPKGAIFIDDSFSERRAVYKKYGIPTFDTSMIEVLIDDRV